VGETYHNKGENAESQRRGEVFIQDFKITAQEQQQQQHEEQESVNQSIDQ